MPAGLLKMIERSSAREPAPAKAMPRPTALFSRAAKPEAAASTALKRSNVAAAAYGRHRVGSIVPPLLRLILTAKMIKTTKDCQMKCGRGPERRFCRSARDAWSARRAKEKPLPLGGRGFGMA